MSFIWGPETAYRADRVRGQRRASPKRGETSDRLSIREFQVACLVAESLSDKQIAQALGLTPGTVKQYLMKIRIRLGKLSRKGLALWVKDAMDRMTNEAEDIPFVASPGDIPLLNLCTESGVSLKQGGVSSTS